VSGQFIGDILFVVLPNKRQLPCIRSALPIDQPVQVAIQFLFVAVETGFLDRELAGAEQECNAATSSKLPTAPSKRRLALNRNIRSIG
jgi:hypothetical protein